MKSRKAGCALIVNASFEYFVKCHILDQFHPYTSFLGKLTEKDVDSYLKKSLAHVPKLQAVKSRKLNLKMSLILYFKSCDASHKLEKALEIWDTQI